MLHNSIYLLSQHRVTVLFLPFFKLFFVPDSARIKSGELDGQLNSHSDLACFIF